MYDVAVAHSLPSSDLPPENPASDPRQRLIDDGVAVLSDVELVSIFMRNGKGTEEALLAAAGLLIELNGIGGLRGIRPEFLEFHGVARVAACQIASAVELGVRFLRDELPESKPLSELPTLAQYLNLRYSLPDQEVMGAMYLDDNQRIVGEREVFRGTLSRTPVEPRAILKEALLIESPQFVLFHTHPSGDPEPSLEDLLFTRRLHEASLLLGVKLLDHIILGDPPRYVSLRRRRGW